MYSRCAESCCSQCFLCLCSCSRALWEQERWLRPLLQSGAGKGWVLLRWRIFPGVRWQILQLQRWEGLTSPHVSDSGWFLGWLTDHLTLHELLQQPSNVAPSSLETPGLFSGTSETTRWWQTIWIWMRRTTTSTPPIRITRWTTAAPLAKSYQWTWSWNK